MKHHLKSLAASLAFCALPTAAQAEDLSECEVLLLQILETETAAGEAQIASYRAAEGFIKSVRDDVPGHMTQIDGQNIRGLMCHRNEVIPTQSDYDILATGIPFILSQDFDSTDTDSLTVYWKDGKFEHVYKGYPLSEEAQAILDTRLAGFSKRGLNDTAHEAADIAAKIAEKEKSLKENAVETDDSAAEIDVDIETEIEIIE